MHLASDMERKKERAIDRQRYRDGQTERHTERKIDTNLNHAL